jgi:hypothetical protein
MDCNKLKDKLSDRCREIFQNKLLIINDELKHLSKAIAEDTKSSAGDKYETGREMANLEKEKLHAQAMGFNKSLATLNHLQNTVSTKIASGSLIKTNKEWIYICISLGPLEIEGEKFLVISPLAPLAQLLIGNEIGHTLTFRDVQYEINEIC